jgi:predicted amidohydrolase YtcJ
VVVRGDRLSLVGGSAEARKLALAAPDARVVDARGRLLVAARGAPGLGTLESGGPADFVVVDRDLARVTPEALRDAPVLLAVAGGRVVEERSADGPASRGDRV